MSFGARFLRHPERFPACSEGEPWGEREVVLDLPGGPYRFAGLSPAQEEGIRSTFPGSLLAARPLAGAAPIESLLMRRAASAFLPVDVRGWEYSLDFDWAPAAVRLSGLGLMARLDWRAGGLTGTLWTRESGGDRFPGVFENFFRVLVAYRLLELGGVVLHSAGVVKDGAAFLFLGRSGAGKTTVAQSGLARGAEVLSDDLNALFPAGSGGPGGSGGSGCVVRKLPFTGDLGERRAARPPVPLAALLRLEQDTTDALLPLSRAEALACLLACAPFVNVDPHRREQLEGALLGLLAEGAPPAFALRFSLGCGFWSILHVK
jgi:hypothetical protein